MRGYMFRNRWFALLFVAITLAAVTRLVGTKEDGGALKDAANEIVQQKKVAETITGANAPTGPESDVVVEFTPDEELIDPASGEDPTPPDEFAQAQADPEAVPHDEVVIVSRTPAEEAPPPTQ